MIMNLLLGNSKADYLIKRILAEAQTFTNISRQRRGHQSTGCTGSRLVLGADKVS